MKKLNKLKLNDFDEMSDSEMKLVTGGSSGSFDGCTDNVSGKCNGNCTTIGGHKRVCDYISSKSGCGCFYS